MSLSSVKGLTDEKIDIVINIDSGHCYSNFKKFAQEVEKVLAPGGSFVYTDFRPVKDWEQIEKDMETCFVRFEKTYKFIAILATDLIILFAILPKKKCDRPSKRKQISRNMLSIL